MKIEPPWNIFTCEYVSPVIWTQLTQGVTATLDISFANRGTMDQRCAILLTEYDFEPQQPSEFNPGAIVYPGRIFLVNWGLVVSGAGDSDTGFDQGWWLRMFTTSRDVVPSIHFYGNPGSPEFYFSAGDFAVFDLPGSFHPPLIGPSEPATES